jgi:hypothetical protein
MGISKNTKIWLIILSIPIILFIIAIVGLKLYLTGDRLKSIVIPEIEKATNRTVTVQDISLSIFPSFAVSIDNLLISNPASIKFDKEKFISLDNLRLKINIFALLSNKLDIKFIILDHPSIYLETREDGISNYSITEGKSADEKITIKVEKKSSGSLLLSNLEIINGEIEYVNKKSDSRLLINGYNQTTKMESKKDENNIEISGKASINELSYGTIKTWFIRNQPLTCTLKIAYDINKDLLTIEDANIMLRELPLTLSGTASKLTTDQMFLDFSITSQNVQMLQVLSLVPPEMLKKTSGLESSGDFKFSTIIKGTLSKTQTPGANGNFMLTNGTIKYAALPKSITGINVVGTFENPESIEGVKSIGNFSIDKLEGMFGTNKIEGKLKITDFNAPIINAYFAGSINLNEVKEFYPLEQGTELTGQMNGNVSIEGKANVPQSIKANGKIEFKNVTIKNANSPKPLSNLVGVVNFNNQIIESKQLAMNIGESDLSLGFIMKNYLALVFEDLKNKNNKPYASINLTSKKLKTSDLISEESTTPSVKNQKETNTTKAMFLPGIDVDANVSIEKLVTEKFEFTNARGSLSIIDGIINLKNFSLNAFQGTVITKGTLDLRDLKKRPFNFDLEIMGVEANSALSKFTTVGKNLFGKFTMNTKLKGSLNDTLGLDTQTLAGDGSVQIFDGKLIGYPLTLKLADFTGINELREVDFKNWSNKFSISDGKVEIKDLKINAGSTDFLVNGTHGLDGVIAYSLNVKLPSSVSDRLNLSGIANQLVQFFKDKEGRFNLDFDVTGTVTTPSLKLNTKNQEEMAKRALEQEKQKLLDQGKKKVEDELKKKAEEGLKKFFKKP